MRVSKLAKRSTCFAIALSLILSACATHPGNVLAPVAETAPDASKVDMLVATTREPVSDPGTLFSGERATAISMTNIVVSVPPDKNRKIGEIQWPSRLPGDPAKDFVTLKTEELASESRVLTWLKRNRGPKKRVLVYVHGFNNTYSDAVYRFAQIAHDARTGAAPVLFTWPSRASMFDYVYDKESTNFSRFALEELLRQAAKSPDVSEVTVLAHSMGSWLAVEALRGMAMRDKGISPKIRNVVLASPDIDVDVFRRQLIEMGPKRPQFTIFASRRDRALAVSKWVSGDVDRVGAADLRPYTPELKQLGITIVDTTDIKAGDPLAHNTFADNPEMVQLLGQRLSGQSLDTGNVSLADRVGVTALGTVRVVGSTAGAAMTAPVAIVSPAARRQLSRQFQRVGTSFSQTVAGQIAY